MTRTIEVATTYNKKYYDICAKRMVESFVRYWPKDIKAQPQPTGLLGGWLVG